MDEKLLETIKSMFKDGTISIELTKEREGYCEDLVLSVKIKDEIVSTSRTTIKHY